MRVLIVEDEHSVGTHIKDNFEAVGFICDYLDQGSEAFEAILVDDYDERAKPPVFVESHSFFESGGKKQYIWRGKLLWRVLTWRPS